MHSSDENDKGDCDIGVIAITPALQRSFIARRRPSPAFAMHCPRLITWPCASRTPSFCPTVMRWNSLVNGISLTLEDIPC